MQFKFLARALAYSPMLMTLGACVSYAPAPPYKFDGTSVSPTIKFRSDFPTRTFVYRVIKAEGKDYCQEQGLGYTKQPGFDSRHDRAKPNEEVVFKVEENKKITLAAQVILKEDAYFNTVLKCGPVYMKFVPQPGANYSMRFMKEGDNACRVDLRTQEGPVAFDRYIPTRGGPRACD